MDEPVKVLIFKDGTILVSKIKEIAGNDIGEPDCVMIDPVVYNPDAELEKCLTRFPGTRVTSDTQMAILSDNILTMVTPENKLHAEYLVIIGD